MASITIRRLPDDVKERLRMKAASNRRSMEEEARHIIQQAVGAGPQASKPKTGADFYRRIREIVDPIGGIELPIIPRNEYPRDPFESR